MSGMYFRYTSRFFEHVGHETSYSLGGKEHFFFNKSCHCHPYQNYEQRQQKLGTFLKIRCINITKFSRVFLSWSPSLIFIIGIKKRERLIFDAEKGLGKFVIFMEVVHNFGRSHDDIIY